MIQGRCPVCSKSYAIAALGDLPSFPFCCERCQLIDLGRWADGRYVIPGAPAATSPESAESGDDVPE
jgi:uncharacterized protein